MTKIEERILVDAYANTQKSEEYKAHQDKIINLGRKIMECLGGRHFLFLEYELAVGLSEGIYMKNIYRIGFEDGRKLSR